MASPCTVRSTRWVRSFTRTLFTLFLTLDPGASVVIELTMIRSIVLDCISALMTLSVRLFALGRSTSSLLRPMFSPPVHRGLSVRLVLIKVYILFPPRLLVMIRRASAAPFESLGLKILTTWFPGRLLTFSVTLRFSELAEADLTLVMGPLIFSPTTEFPLNRCLTRVSVSLSVPRWLVSCPLLTPKTSVFVTPSFPVIPR